MSPTLITFLFEAANFLILAAVLGWLFFQPVRQALADRQARFADEARSAEEKLQEAERIQQQVAAAQQNLQTELDETRVKTLAEVQKEADELLARARAAIEREKEANRRQQLRFSEAEKETLAQAVARATAETVGSLLIQIGAPDLHHALVASACQQLRALPDPRLGRVRVESAAALTPEEQARINEALGASAEDAEFRVDRGLGAGVRLTTNQGLIDATVSGLTLFAKQSLVSELTKQANNHHFPRAAHDA